MSESKRSASKQRHHDYYVTEARKRVLEPDEMAQYYVAMERERNGEVAALPRLEVGVPVTSAEQAQQILTVWFLEQG